MKIAITIIFATEERKEIERFHFTCEAWKARSLRQCIFEGYDSMCELDPTADKEDLSSTRLSGT